MPSFLKYATLATALAFIPATAHAAMTAEQCTAMFNKADANGDGSLGGSEGTRYEEAMKKRTIETKDANIISMEEFMSACESGTFDGMDSM